MLDDFSTQIQIDEYEYWYLYNLETMGEFPL